MLLRNARVIVNRKARGVAYRGVMHALDRLGPLAIGATVGGAVVRALTWRDGVVMIAVELASGDAVEFALAASASRPGPFAALPALSYRTTAVAFATLAPVGAALASALAPLGPAAVAPPAWDDVVRGLGDDPAALVRLADLVPDDVLARAPRCVAPWTRLEYAPRQQFGPCCVDFQTAPARGDAAPLVLWRDLTMRAFRRALTTPAPSTCRATCPRWLGASDDLRSLILRGGPAAFRANQIAAVRAMLHGDDDPPSTPLELVFPATSYCNYDCLMCSHGAEGSLADERAPAFYDGLAPLLPGLGRLEALGGEPLASPVFRQFLAGPVWRAHPQLELALTTNGSYLGPDELARYRDVRFAHVTVSLNAATDVTYAAVNRGLPLARVRRHLDALRARRPAIALTYSFVILRANLHELAAFAAWAAADDVAVRFMLPMGDRNQQSILRDGSAMREAHDALATIADDLRQRGCDREASRVDGERAVLTQRQARGVLRALPD